MPRKPAAHGGERRYRSGCRCQLCLDGAKARNARRRAPRDADDRPVLTILPPPAPEESVSDALRAALSDAHPEPDASTRYRIIHALRLAEGLDDRNRPHLWRQLSSSLAELLTVLLPATTENTTTAAAVRDISTELARRAAERTP